MATILGKNHFTILQPISGYRCKDGLKVEKLGSKGVEDMGGEIVFNKKGANTLRKFYPHLSHNDRELLFVGSVCKQEVERPDDLKNIIFVHKLKICLVRSSLEMISRKKIIFAKTYSLLVYCRRIVEGG